MSVTNRPIHAPAVGRFIAPQQHPSALLHNHILGSGPVIEVSGSQLLAPADATVTAISSSGDFIHLTLVNGGQLRLILGDGCQFQWHPALRKCCANQQQVKQGEVLVEINQALLRSGPPTHRYLAILLEAGSEQLLSSCSNGSANPDQPLPMDI